MEVVGIHVLIGNTNQGQHQSDLNQEELENLICDFNATPDIPPNLPDGGAGNPLNPGTTTTSSLSVSVAASVGATSVPFWTFIGLITVAISPLLL